MNDANNTDEVNVPRRILVIDDNPEIHKDFRSVFEPEPDTSALDDLTRQMLGDDKKPISNVTNDMNVEVDSSLQGKEGLDMLNKALREGNPYEVAFVDMRMPPGWDGLETIQNLWKADPSLQVVICTAYSDYEWDEIRQTLGGSDSLLVIKKPFDAVEVIQMSYALSTKWRAARALDKKNQRLKDTVEQLYFEIQQRHDAERALQHKVHHDELTSLPNRTFITKSVEESIARAKRKPGYQFAFCFLDLDQFKYINDSLGHQVGDQLLVEIAKRLSNSTKKLCSDLMIHDAQAARIGGDEFVILFDDVKEKSQIESFIKLLQKEIAKPSYYQGHEISVSSSFGIALCDANYGDVGLVLRDADTALYDAKENGRDRYAFFNDSMHASIARRMTLETELRRAIERKQLYLTYQPIINLEDGTIAGFEALLRWSHPDLGMISPVEFLPIAEDCGLIAGIGNWVLREGCTEYKHWRDNIEGTENLFLHINVSPRQFAIANFPDTVRDIINEIGVDPKHIALEVTETAIMADRKRVIDQIQHLADDGHAIAMDDFGVGHSSLGYLHEMPLSCVKIDRNFVKQIDPKAKYINTIKAIVEMCHNRKIYVVAEGIETLEQLVQLQTIECNYGQGFLFSPAISPTDAEELLRFHKQWLSQFDTDAA